MLAIGPSREGSGVRPADLLTCKQEGRPIAALTAWDALSAALVEQAGADLILVGDSLAMVVLGHTTTLPVTLEEMLHHTRATGRGSEPAVAALSACMATKAPSPV